MLRQFFLPLPTYPDQISDVMIGNAVEFAKNCSVLLHATVVEVAIPAVVNPWSALLIDVDKMVWEAERASRLAGERLKAVVEQRCTAAAIKPDCETLTISQPNIADTVAEIARHYDLTLLQSALQFEALSQAVVFGSGRPAILYPEGSFSGRIDHVAIAWDGSRAAARAMADAAPFIASASEVSIIYALDEKPLTDPGRRVFDTLAARGIKAEAYPFHVHQLRIGDALQSKALEIGADLLVMGGYGHSRMREFILGGATADVLGNPRLRVLMSH